MGKTEAEWMCEWMCPTNTEQLILDIANYMIDHKCSVRKVAEDFSLPKSTVHKYLTKDLAQINDELFVCCKNIMKGHKADRKRDERGRFA